jgi:hypothetical protein
MRHRKTELGGLDASRFPISYIVVFLLCAWCCSVARAQSEPACNNNSVYGSFGLRLTRISLSPARYVFIGRLVADGKGTLRGDGTESNDGLIARPTFTGSYSISTDCTGSATLSFSSGATISFAFGVEASGDQIDWMQTGPAGSTSDIEIGKSKKQFTEPPR